MRIQKYLPQCTNTSQTQKLSKYARWLLKIGEGSIHYNEHKSILSIPHEFTTSTVEQAIDHIYGNLQDHLNNEEFFKTRSILAPTNSVITKINKDMLEKLPGNEFLFESIDSVPDQDVLQAPIEFLHKLDPSGVPPHELRLKIGAPIMLIRNLDLKNGHCNGVRYIVLQLTQHHIYAKKMGIPMSHPQSTIYIPRIPIIKKSMGLPFLFKRIQLPVKLAFAMTINKSQGQSLDACSIILEENVFAHGQLYVAWSRCGNPNYVKIYADQSNINIIKHNQDYLVKNVVYTEALT